jgi:hypothetical protein
VTSAGYFQSALSSRQLKLRQKKANISGLQLADLLGHPTKMWALRYYDLIGEEPAPFAKRLMKSLSISSTDNYILTGWKVMGLCSIRKNKRASYETLLRSPLRAIHLRLAD